MPEVKINVVLYYSITVIFFSVLRNNLSSPRSTVPARHKSWMYRELLMLLNSCWSNTHQSCMAAVHIYSWQPQVCFQIWLSLKPCLPWGTVRFPHSCVHHVPRGASQWIFMMLKDNLRVSGWYARGLRFRLSWAVSPDHGFQYQITGLLKTPSRDRFLLKSPGLDLSEMGLRISGLNLKLESARLHNLRAILNAESKKRF